MTNNNLTGSQNFQWVQANAGTGKTYFLVHEFVALLLKGASPLSILCLTFSNNASFEIQNRINELFQELIRANTTELTEKCRRDFPFLLDGSICKISNLESYIDSIYFNFLINSDKTMIMTFHTFCSTILSTFSFELKRFFMYGQHTNENNIDELISSIPIKLETLLRSYRAQEKVDNLFKFKDNTIKIDEIDKALNIIFEEGSDVFEKKVLRGINSVLNISAMRNIYSNFESWDDILRQFEILYVVNFEDKIILFNDDNEEKKILEILKNIKILYEQNLSIIKSGDTKSYNLINSILDNPRDMSLYEKLFLTGAGTVRAKQLNKGFSNIVPQDQLEGLEDLKDKYINFHTVKNNQKNMIVSSSILLLRLTILELFQIEKESLGWNTYNDIIFSMLDISQEPDMIGFLMEQFDVKISHMLIDESQDTSKEQWNIFKELIETLITDDKKSLKIVGDPKQSIYSFQGADSKSFSDTKTYLNDFFDTHKLKLDQKVLDTSFRSSPVITDFTTHYTEKFIPDYKGIHKTTRYDLDGEIKIHPVKEKDKFIEYTVEQIKDTIKSKKLEPSDVLILYRKNMGLEVSTIFKGLAEEYPIVGFKTGAIQKSPIVQELLALIQIARYQYDDFALAYFLTSVWNKLTLVDLETITQEDGKSLFVKLKRYNEKYKNINYIFDNIKTISETLNTANSILDFFVKLNCKIDIKEQLILKYGVVADNLYSSFLNYVIEWDKTKSLDFAGFYEWITNTDNKFGEDVKGNNAIKIMTIHGAKGLEAKAVFLIDSTFKIKDEDILFDDKTKIMFPAKYKPETFCDLSSKIEDEENRLLYVAMTRAKSIFHVFAMSNFKLKEDCWYNKLIDTIEKLDPMRYDDGSFSIKYQGTKVDNLKCNLPNTDGHIYKISSKSTYHSREKGQEVVSRDPSYEEKRGTFFHNLIPVLVSVDRSRIEEMIDAKLKKNFIFQEDKLLFLRWTDLLYKNDTAYKIISNKKAIFEAEIITENNQIRRIDFLLIVDNIIYLIDFKTDTKKSNRYYKQLSSYHKTVKSSRPDTDIKTFIYWVNFGELDELDL